MGGGGWIEREERKTRARIRYTVCMRLFWLLWWEVVLVLLAGPACVLAPASAGPEGSVKTVFKNILKCTLGLCGIYYIII